MAGDQEQVREKKGRLVKCHKRPYFAVALLQASTISLRCPKLTSSPQQSPSTCKIHPWGYLIVTECDLLYFC